MSKSVTIGDREIGPGHPCYIVGEIGINHNGDVEIAKDLIRMAEEADCQAVKFQKRTPELCVPPEQHDVPRETPWGIMSYMDYRHKIEFGRTEYEEIDAFCRDRSLFWFASCWDVESVEFMRDFAPPALKVPSACITNLELLEAYADADVPIVMSTGMSTSGEIREAVETLGDVPLILTHCTSTYPCPPSELNLKVIQTLDDEYDCPIGYSGHEVGLATTVAAVALGACLVERHITLDRAMWGSDQSASVEPQGLRKLVRDIRVLEEALGDGVKRVYESEREARERLRWERPPEGG